MPLAVIIYLQHLVPEAVGMLIKLHNERNHAARDPCPHEGRDQHDYAAHYVAVDGVRHVVAVAHASQRDERPVGRIQIGTGRGRLSVILLPQADVKAGHPMEGQGRVDHKLEHLDNLQGQAHHGNEHREPVHHPRQAEQPRQPEHPQRRDPALGGRAGAAGARQGPHEPDGDGPGRVHPEPARVPLRMRGGRPRAVPAGNASPVRLPPVVRHSRHLLVRRPEGNDHLQRKHNIQNGVDHKRHHGLWLPQYKHVEGHEIAA
mmetsp:Transcript_114402/g.324596  ORF Transcript_114402/g.324596 Transcript_114402/m.324596 type:complete len:260 (-) Transcript_114402:1138-1917(-)